MAKPKPKGRRVRSVKGRKGGYGTTKSAPINPNNTRMDVIAPRNNFAGAPGTGRQPRVPRAPGNIMVKELTQQVCALTDPFCPASRSARMPDGNGTRTLSYDTIVSGFLNSDVEGELCAAFRPSYSYNYNIGTTIVSQATLAATWSQLFTLATPPAEYRVTSFGVRFMSNMVPTTERGEMWALTAPFPLIISGVYATANTNYWLERQSSTVKNGKIMEWVATRCGNKSYQFVAPNANLNMNEDQDPGWTELLVIATGLEVSNPAIRYEAHVHFEYCPAYGTDVAAYVQKPPPEAPLIKRAAQLAQTAGAQALTVMNVGESQQHRENIAEWAVRKVLAMGAGFMAEGPLGAAMGAFFG